MAIDIIQGWHRSRCDELLGYLYGARASEARLLVDSAVDPALGDWGDLEALGKGRKRAFDLVLNLASARGAWFKAFKAGLPPYDRCFLTRPLDYDGTSCAHLPLTLHAFAERRRKGYVRHFDALDSV